LAALQRSQRSPRWWLPAVAVVVLAFFVRLPTLSTMAFEPDLRHFAEWMRVMDMRGLWEFYKSSYRFDETDRLYPPLSTLSFAALIEVNGGTAPNPRFAMRDPNFIVQLKVFPVACELLLIGAVALWLSDRPRLRWTIPIALAVAPGIVATTGWWGQYDAPFTAFVVLALLALNRDRPLWAWILFAIAALIKQPAAVVAPILLVVTFRRYGWRRTLISGVVSAAVFLLVTLPFALESGWEDALAPYLHASDAFPYFSNNAYNFWHALASIDKGGLMLFREPAYADAQLWIGGLSYKAAGLILFGTFVLLIMVLCWRQAHQKREFVWAAALFYGFFILPTQVHERYLFPAAVLLIIAIAQDRRVLPAAIAASVTYAYNIFAVTSFDDLSRTFLAPANFALPIALLNVVTFGLLVRWAVVDGVEQAAPSLAAPAAVASPHAI
jgi:hypothetical protein